MRLFVYGTLKAGYRRNFYLTQGGARLLAVARTAPRYRLYRPRLVDYPVLVERSPGAAVAGEVWEVDDGLLPRLDFLEAGYRRVPVEVPGHDDVQAYLCPRKPWFAVDLGDEF